MERKYLKDLGLSDEIIDKVMAENGKDIEKSKADSTAAQTTIADLQKQLKDRDTDIAALKKSAGDNADLTKQFTDLQSKYKTDTEALNAKIKDNALSAALDLGITRAKGKNARAIKALVDTSKLKLKEDNTVEGLDDALDALKESDGYLFEQVTTTPKGPGNPGGTGVTNPESPEAKTVADAFAAARGNI